MNNTPLGLAHLSALDLPPPQFIRAAAEAGFESVGLRFVAVNDVTPGYPLMSDAKMLRETKSALAETGLRVNDVEFLKFEPTTDPGSFDALIETAAELGAKSIITAPYDDDLTRLGDNLGQFADLTAAKGIQAVLEFFPWTVINDLASCWALVQNSSEHLGILVDSLHFNRSNSSIELLKSIPADRLPFAQLCDAPVQSSYTFEELIYAGRDERLAPGLGEISIAEIVDALPSDIAISLEVPQIKKTKELGESVVLRQLFSDTQAYLKNR
ncbi:Xylose isomerase-like TIM barrel [Marinobacterium sp. xm-g-59]|uniref:sugar phosphate isomerase/epimerase family protein n=1 Tax=Marinobacterium sp. xm-g-59 TaxID=2497748 RepID=UPI0015692DCA|nr:TIM barrel protein [Marinobacterium sp. xm-g-59]NRP95933.1 Xylose isomerase-like TIM barrel [Marinobacterium sp. xm-g-59]